MNDSPGNKDSNIAIETAEEYKMAVIRLLLTAHHNIDIFTRDLEAQIYNHIEIEQAVFKLAKRHPNTRIRILLQDFASAAQNGHCLIRLAQQLTSSVFIHSPAGKYKDEPSAFVIVDETAFIHRVSAHGRNYHATVNYSSPHDAAKLTDFFNEVWEHSSPDSQTRRLSI